MEGPRSPAENELDSVVGFLNQNLRQQKNWSISDEYPTAICRSNLHNIRIIKEEDKVLSHAVWRPLLVKTQFGLFKLAVIGSVVTDSAYRNQGLSKQILEDCLDKAMQAGCDIAILWTDLFDFYRKLGFELAGFENTFVIDKALKTEPMQLKILEGNRFTAESMLRLYEKHSVSSVRGLEDIKRYLQIPSARVYTAWDGNNQMQAYLVEGKGADLDSYIHEWGGNINPLSHLINYVQKEQKRNLHLMVPKHSVNLNQKLIEQNFNLHSGHLGMIKLLNVNSIFSKIQRYASSNLGVYDLVFRKVEDRYLFGMGSQMFETKSESDMIRLLFGPQKASDLYVFEKNLKTIFEKILPLPLWVWGWDSI